jgi:large subunit ribosomal protein L16
MLLQPRKFNFKKRFKKLKIKKKKEKIIFGEYALKSLENIKLTAKQIETAKQTINKKLKKLGFVWHRIFPQNPITKKPSEIRMGKGKGAVDHWSAFIYEGTILFEISGISKELAIQALTAGAKKLPQKTKIIFKGL